MNWGCASTTSGSSGAADVGVEAEGTTHRAALGVASVHGSHPHGHGDATAVEVAEAPDYERFCREAHPQLVAAFAHQFGDRWLAEELAQEALIRAGLHWSRVSGFQAPVGWAFRVGCNLGTSVLRRRGVEQRALRRQHAETVAAGDDATATPDGDLAAGLAALPEAQRRAVVARFYLDLSPEQAAVALDTTPGNVRVLTHRALQRLRAAVPNDDTEESARVH